jgi:hypothetical protein
MATFWAQFERLGDHLFRFDTRVYLNDVAMCRDSDPVIGAIVAKNPGSALPSDRRSNELQPVSLNGGRLLATAYTIVKKAFLRADRHWPETGYVQVFNLFYLRDKNAKRAWQIASQLKLPTCPKESLSFPWLWYAWGRMGNELPDLSNRFSGLSAVDRFYFDKLLDEIGLGHPTLTAFPKHTQGLKHEPIIAHIAKLLTKRAGRDKTEFAT